jgi:hypothetical protein
MTGVNTPLEHTRILVTGGAGFLHLVRALERRVGGAKRAGGCSYNRCAPTHAIRNL